MNLAISTLIFKGKAIYLVISLRSLKMWIYRILVKLSSIVLGVYHIYFITSKLLTTAKCRNTESVMHSGMKVEKRSEVFLKLLFYKCKLLSVGAYYLKFKQHFVYCVYILYLVGQTSFDLRRKK